MISADTLTVRKGTLDRAQGPNKWVARFSTTSFSSASGSFLTGIRRFFDLVLPTLWFMLEFIRNFKYCLLQDFLFVSASY
jgi:hypothetical protein